jgi:alpha-kinase family protein
MSNPTQVIVIDSSLAGVHYRAHLIYDPDDRIGMGTFKTANRATLEFDNMRPSVGLGSTIALDKLVVALKRPFLEVKTTSNQPSRSVNSNTRAPVSRLTVTDEQHAVTGEAKLLVWVKALFEFTYDFIFDYAQNNHAPPGVEDFMSIIPVFRFVDGGVAVVVKPLETSAGRPSTQRATYILEEILPGTKEDFSKYLNNSSVTTLIKRDESESDYLLAEFLMFMQHVQYQITHGTAYISDLQGKKVFASPILYIFIYPRCWNNPYRSSDHDKTRTGLQSFR